ncbi:MAG: hypothetical protein Sapg2KO_12400 [Saprospiraceae bacterium]
MKGDSLKELIKTIDSIISKNRDLLSESDLNALKMCKKRLKELENLKVKESYELRNKIIADAVSFLLKFFLSDL